MSGAPTSLLSVVATAIEAPDFEAWFRQKHGTTLAEGWKHKPTRRVIIDACEVWAAAQHAQRAQTDKEIKLGIYKAP